MYKIGKQLRRLRELRGYTQREMALAADITERAYGAIENDKTVPGGDTWVKLADFLQVKMDELREPRPPESLVDLETRLMDAARRAQAGDQGARNEMRRLSTELAQADAGRVESERSSSPKSFEKGKARKR